MKALDRAMERIERRAILLVYPIDNRPEPPSLWSELHPRTPMRWEWDESGDDRVARLWRLREELSRGGRVVYAKWYRGRATFFARDAFVALLAAYGTARSGRERLSREARELLAALELDSPLSTKELKRAVGLAGRANAAAYERAMKELWSDGWIVGFGERDDGAFPSLLVGATSLLFEELWSEAASRSPEQGLRALRERLPADSPFLRELERGPARGRRQKLPARGLPSAAGARGD